MKFTSVPQFHLLISCPGDVEPERIRVMEICVNLQKTFRLIKEPVSIIPLFWKDIVGAHGTLRPQSLINLIFSEYGFYIGLLWRRFGTETVDLTDARKD